MTDFYKTRSKDDQKGTEAKGFRNMLAEARNSLWKSEVTVMAGVMMARGEKREITVWVDWGIYRRN